MAATRASVATRSAERCSTSSENLSSVISTWMALLNTMDDDLESENLFAGILSEPAGPSEPSETPGTGLEHEEPQGADSIEAALFSAKGEEEDVEMSALLREVQEGLDTPLFGDGADGEEEPKPTTADDAPDEAAAEALSIEGQFKDQLLAALAYLHDMGELIYIDNDPRLAA